MFSLSSPGPMMRDNSAAIIFIALEFLFTHTISFCPHIETAVWGFLLDNPSIGYLRNILGVVGHVYSHAELIEVLTNPLPDHQIRRKQRALEKVGRKLHWNPTSNPRGSVFNLTGHRYLQLMKEASLNKWWSWQRARPQATRFPGMSAVDKFKTLWRVGQLLDWISWASETHGCAELLPLPKRLHDAISSTDADTNASIRGLRGLKRVVAEMRESLVPLQFANGRPRRGRPLLGCQDDCGGKISGLRKAAMCDSCLSDAPLGASPKTISEVRGNLAPRKQADPVEQQPIQTREDTGQLRAKAEAEIKECNKHKPSTYVTYGFKHRRIS